MSAVLTNAIGRMLEVIERKAALTGADVANVLDTNVATVSRWKTGKSFPQPKHADLLLQLEYVAEQLSDIYEAVEARLWLFRPQKLLGGERPADLLSKGLYKDVLAALNQVRDDVHM